VQLFCPKKKSNRTTLANPKNIRSSHIKIQTKKSKPTMGKFSKDKRVSKFLAYSRGVRIILKLKLGRLLPQSQRGWIPGQIRI
jgi:hypothetical protein